MSTRAKKGMGAIRRALDMVGTAICGIRRSVAAMLRGWHANNGVGWQSQVGFVSPGDLDGQRGSSTTRSGITISRPRSGCSFRRASAVRRSRLISRRACPGTHGRRNGCRRCFATMRWSTSPRSCRRRSGCSARKRAAISPAPPRGSSGCTPSTRQLGCWAAWKRAGGFRQALAPAARGRSDAAAVESSARSCANTWRLMAEREALSPRCSSWKNWGWGRRWRMIVHACRMTEPARGMRIGLAIPLGAGRFVHPPWLSCLL